MIIYFANRSMEIQGSASTGLPGGFTIVEDTKTEEIETGVAVLNSIRRTACSWRPCARRGTTCCAATAT